MSKLLLLLECVRQWWNCEHCDGNLKLKKGERRLVGGFDDTGRGNGEKRGLISMEFL